MKSLNVLSSFILIVANLSPFTMNTSNDPLKHFHGFFSTLLDLQQKHEFFFTRITQIIQNSERSLEHSTIAIYMVDSNGSTTTSLFFEKLTDISCSIPVIFLEEKVKSSQKLVFSRKHTTPLSIVLADWYYKNITDIQSSIINKFTNMLALHDNYGGFILRNKDFFLFLAKGMDACKQIMFSEIKTLVKFKVCLCESKIAQFQTVIEKVTISPFFPSEGSNRRGKVINLLLHNKHKVNLLQDFTWNYYGYKLQMAISQLYKPVYEVKVLPFGKVVPKRGFFMDFTETIFAKLNLTTNKFLCSGYGKYAPGSLTGTLLKNGTWVGCLGDVISGHAEISVAAPDANRYGKADFLPSFVYVSIAFVTRKPVVVISWKAIYKAFTLPTWLLTGVFIGCLSTIVSYGKIVVAHLKFDEQWSAFAEVGFKMMRSILNQGVIFQEKIGIGGNIVLIVWLQCSWILATAYTSKLTSLLTIPTPEDDIPETFDILVESKYFIWGAPKLFILGIGGEILKSSKSPMMQRLHSKMKQDEDGISCLRRAERENYACISWNFLLDFDQAVEFNDKSEKISLQGSIEGINFIPLTQVMKKRSIFSESFSYFVNNVYEMGLMKKWTDLDKMKLRLKRRLENWQNTTSGASRKVQTDVDTEKPHSFKLINFQGSFGILLVGFCASLLGLLWELKSNRVPKLVKDEEGKVTLSGF